MRNPRRRAKRATNPAIALLLKSVGFVAASRLEFRSGAVAMRYEPRT